MRELLKKLLTKEAKTILKKYKPEIVGITGSVGKSSSKQAITAILKTRFDVRATAKNYNNEFGLPLTIIGMKPAGSSFFGWLNILLKGYFISFGHIEYPKMLILEMGSDKPGDIHYLTSIAPCKIAVLTAIGLAHYEFFENIDALISEKKSILECLATDGIAVLNNDNEHIAAISKEVPQRAITYGLSENSYVRADNIRVEYENGVEQIIKGMSCVIHINDEILPIQLIGVLGSGHISAILAGVAVGYSCGMTLAEMATGISRYLPLQGRMRILDGIKHTTIIDDTYNASPSAMRLALEETSKLFLAEGSERYVVLGDMLELGSKTESEHLSIGRDLLNYNVDVLVCVGERSRDIGRGAREAGMEEHCIVHFANASLAGTYLREQLEKGDIVLCKASRGIGLEYAVEKIMAEPLRANELLCGFER